MLMWTKMFVCLFFFPLTFHIDESLVLLGSLPGPQPGCVHPLILLVYGPYSDGGPAVKGFDVHVAGLMQLYAWRKIENDLAEL